MDGNSKEEFCTMCSVEVPSAFKNDEDENIDGNVIIVEKKENCSNISKMFSKLFLKIFMFLIILVFVYFLFKKPDLKK
jgi:hypothetical protein